MWNFLQSQEKSCPELGWALGKFKVSRGDLGNKTPGGEKRTREMIRGGFGAGIAPSPHRFPTGAAGSWI